MFIESLVSRAKGRLWRYFLPRFTLKNHVDDQVYNYYGVYFSDVKQEKYQLVNLRGKNVVLEMLNNIRSLAMVCDEVLINLLR